MSQQHPPRSRGWGGEPSRKLDDWLAIAPDGTVTVYSGKAELGQGARTALAQIVAEELDVDLSRIQMVMNATGLTPNEGITAGSQTIATSGMRLRRAAASARELLLEMAGAELGLAPSELTVANGVITPRDQPGPRVTYGGLLAGAKFDRDVSDTAPLKRPEEYHIVGHAAQRLDLPQKFSGQPAFIHDFRLPGMLHARLVRPPRPGATLAAVDDATLPAGARVIRVENFVAVVAAREIDAIHAARDLRLTWNPGPELPAMETAFEAMRQQAAPGHDLVARGEAAVALNRAVTRLSATYTVPYQAHASIGPSCAVADYDGTTLRVWCPTPGAYLLRGSIAEMLELPEERVQVTHMEGAGAYGQNGADDAGADAALIARELRQPVRLQWSRADEFAWEPKAPAMRIEVAAGLDGAGAISGWTFEAWSPPHGNRPTQAGRLVSAQLIGFTEPPAPPYPVGGERNAPTDYTMPDQRVTLHTLPFPAIRVSSYRSLGAFANAFANEAFFDELAKDAGEDPLTFRLRYLDDPRGRAALAAAARRANWGDPLPVGRGRGLAFARYENTEAYCATVAEVSVDSDSGAVHVERVVVAHDCGQIISPDGVRNQVEGNVIQSLSRALKEEYRYTPEGIVSLDWQTYPILRFSEVPQIEVELIDRPDVAPVGAGEAATITTAPAVANAIYAACGARLRDIPFTPERLRAALATIPLID